MVTCKEAQGLIVPYINDKLDIKQLEQFLEHIETCSDCREELEVYFTLLTGMKQLDEDKNLSGNLHVAFEKSLHKSEEKIRKVKLNYVRKRVIYVIVCIVFCIMTNTRTDEELNAKSEPKSPVESRYMFRYYYFFDKPTLLSDVARKHYSDMMKYSIENNAKNIIEYDQGILDLIDQNEENQDTNQD